MDTFSLEQAEWIFSLQMMRFFRPRPLPFLRLIPGLLFAGMLLGYTPPGFSDILRLRNSGEEYHGKIQSMSGASVQFLTQDGVSLRVPRANVDKLVFRTEKSGHLGWLGHLFGLRHSDTQAASESSQPRKTSSAPASKTVDTRPESILGTGWQPPKPPEISSSPAGLAKKTPSPASPVRFSTDGLSSAKSNPPGLSKFHTETPQPTVASLLNSPGMQALSYKAPKTVKPVVSPLKPDKTAIALTLATAPASRPAEAMAYPAVGWGAPPTSHTLYASFPEIPAQNAALPVGVDTMGNPIPTLGALAPATASATGSPVVTLSQVKGAMTQQPYAGLYNFSSPYTTRGSFWLRLSQPLSTSAQLQLNLFGRWRIAPDTHSPPESYKLAVLFMDKTGKVIGHGAPAVFDPANPAFQNFREPIQYLDGLSGVLGQLPVSWPVPANTQSLEFRISALTPDPGLLGAGPALTVPVATVNPGTGLYTEGGVQPAASTFSMPVAMPVDTGLYHTRLVGYLSNLTLQAR